MNMSNELQILVKKNRGPRFQEEASRQKQAECPKKSAVEPGFFSTFVAARIDVFFSVVWMSSLGSLQPECLWLTEMALAIEMVDFFMMLTGGDLRCVW